ncbi:MAG: TraM recognition domain-containing protein [Pseudomonadota bacterium]|uniref:type IV secretory system conjugative DNA transfer family protein n=1 Tax=Sphingobium sp. TaxID=1912891 RepID=UPI002E2006EA
MALRTGDLDTPLFKLDSNSAYTVRDACQGTLILGGVGSGKTSGSGATMAAAFLKAGMGGLVLCAKPEEADLWRAYCAKHGRSGSLIECDGTNAHINMLAYELARQGGDGLNSVVELLMRVLEIARLASPSPGRAGEHFWDDTLRQILRNAIPPLFAATGTVKISDLLRFVRSAPSSPDEMANPDWQKQSYFCHVFLTAAERLRAGPVAGFDDRAGERATSYWRNDYAKLDPKTRASVQLSLTTALDRFNHGWLEQMFCTTTDIVPELSLHGVILLMNMPALTKNEDGIIAQQIVKYLWQRAVLARNALAAPHQQRPTFLWADEAQYFVNSYDAEFLSTCRGSRICTVFLSQSLPTFYAKIGGDNAHDRTHHLLGNFGTKVFHNPGGCSETADWAARIIGKGIQWRRNESRSQGTSSQFGLNMGENTNWGTNSSGGGSSSYNNGAGGSSYGGGSSWSSGTSSGGGDQWGRNRSSGSNSGQSWGGSEVSDWLIEPGQFSRMLKTGGPPNGNIVSAVWYQAGRIFPSSGGNALYCEFVQ